jgi:hypothetical protein
MIAYPMVQFQPQRVSYFCACILVIALSTNAFGLVIAAGVSDRMMGVMLSPLALVPFLLTTGFFVRVDALPAVIAWIAALSPQRYAFEAMMISEFSGLNLSCNDDEFMVFPSASSPDGVDQFCPVVYGEDVLDLFGFHHNIHYIGYLIGMMLILTIAARIIAYGALKMSSKSARQQAFGV